MTLSTWFDDTATSILIFGQEAHRIFGPAVNFRVALLTSVTFDFGDGHPVHPHRGECVADLVELEWLDDGHDDFHGFDLPLKPAPRQPDRALPHRERAPTSVAAGSRRDHANQAPCQLGCACRDNAEERDFWPERRRNGPPALS